MGRATRSSRTEGGYTLAVVVVFTSVLLVFLSEAALNWQTAMKREREEELIFRGKQYQRALVLWYAHWSKTLGTPQVVYPSTIDALLNTNNKRFLRRKWKDPITNDEWRLIKVGPNNRPLLTVLPTPAAESMRAGQNPYGSGDAGQSPGAGRQVPGPTPSTGGQTAYGQTLETQPLGSSVIGGIAGVASTSEKESLKIFNGRNKYNEWEFFTDFAALSARAQRRQPGQTPQPPGQPGQTLPGRRSPAGQSSLFGAPGQSAAPPVPNPGNRPGFPPSQTPRR